MGLILGGTIVAVKGGAQEDVSLAGTAMSPRTVFFLEEIPNVGIAQWLFAGTSFAPSSVERGDAQKAGFRNGVQATYTSDSPATTWIVPKDFQGTYYIRATLEADTAPNSTGSASLNTWIQIVNGGSNVIWGWQRGTLGTVTGTIKVEIATDSQGNDIVATGYYKGTVTIESGG